jgi:hypothetical protein
MDASGGFGGDVPRGGPLAAIRAAAAASGGGGGGYGSGALVPRAGGGALALAVGGGSGVGLDMTGPSPLSAEASTLVRAHAEAWVARERGAVATDKFVIGLRARALTARVDQHQRTERALRMIESDVSESLEKGTRSRQTLDSLESRIIFLRNSMRAANDADAAMSALANAAEGGGTEFGRIRSQMATSTIGKVKTAAELVEEELNA